MENFTADLYFTKHSVQTGKGEMLGFNDALHQILFPSIHILQRGIRYGVLDKPLNCDAGTWLSEEISRPGTYDTLYIALKNVIKNAGIETRTIIFRQDASNILWVLSNDTNRIGNPRR